MRRVQIQPRIRHTKESSTAREVVNIQDSQKRSAPGLKGEIMEGSLALERVDAARVWRGGM